MTTTKHLISIAALAIGMLACSGQKSESAVDSNTSDSIKEMAAIDSSTVKVEVSTTLGNFTLLLYGDTPKHRDNFLKLVKDGTYNGVLFHRVIKDFMVQGGDPDSKEAAPDVLLGEGDLGYTIEAEIVYPKHYHKRGALAAARLGDEINPEQRSSASQFYVVTGSKFSDEKLAQAQLQATAHQIIEEKMDEIRRLQATGDQQGLMALEKSIIAEANQLIAEGKGALSEEMLETYKTKGGAPHLDGSYTVFGEVISGMDTIDKIEAAETNKQDRPKQDIRILSMKVIE